MKEPRELYDQSHRTDLRDTYPSFYLALTNFIFSLPKRWFFMNCYNIDYDGSRLQIRNPPAP